MLDLLLAPFLALFALKVGWIVALWIGLVLIAGAIFSGGRLRDLLASSPWWKYSIAAASDALSGQRSVG